MEKCDDVGEKGDRRWKMREGEFKTNLVEIGVYEGKR